MIFVELCAGSAAVSLRWLSGKAKPPLSLDDALRIQRHALGRDFEALAGAWAAEARRLRDEVSAGCFTSGMFYFCTRGC